MKCVVLYKQSGEGCDYMINCGVNFEFVEGDNIDDIKEKILYPDGREERCILDSRDIGYDSILVIPYIKILDLDLDTEIKRLKEGKEKEKKENELAAAEIEFERLKKLLKK